MQKAESHQRKVLIEHNRRKEADKEEAEAARAEGEGAPRRPRKMVVHAQAQAVGEGDSTRIDALVLFEHLLEPMCAHMGCSKEDRDWIEANWSKEPELQQTLADWASKVILYGITVSDEARESCGRVFKQGQSCLLLPSERAPGRDTTGADAASSSAEATIERDATSAQRIRAAF